MYYEMQTKEEEKIERWKKKSNIMGIALCQGWQILCCVMLHAQVGRVATILLLLILNLCVIDYQS